MGQGDKIGRFAERFGAVLKKSVEEIEKFLEYLQEGQ